MSNNVDTEQLFSKPEISHYFDQALVARISDGLKDRQTTSNISFARQAILALSSGGVRESRQDNEIYYLLVLLKAGEVVLVEDYIHKSLLKLSIASEKKIESIPSVESEDPFSTVEALFNTVSDDTEFGSTEALQLNQAIRQYWQTTPVIMATLQGDFDIGKIDKQSYEKQRNELYINLFAALSVAAQEFNAGPAPKTSLTLNQIEFLGTIDQILAILDRNEKGSAKTSDNQELEALINQSWFIHVDPTATKRGVKTSDVLVAIGEVLVLFAGEGLVK